MCSASAALLSVPLNTRRGELVPLCFGVRGRLFCGCGLAVYRDLFLVLQLVGICARWMTFLLNSFSFVPLLVGICAKMDDTSFEFFQVFSSAGRDLRRDR